MLEDIFVSDGKCVPSSQKPFSTEDVRIVSYSVTLVWFLHLDLFVVYWTQKDLNILLSVGYIPKLSDNGNLPHGSLDVSMVQKTCSKFLLQTEASGNKILQ